MFWLFVFLMWIFLVVTIFTDLVRASMSGWAKALWTIVIVVVPFFGVVAYLVVNGGQMGRRSDSESAAKEERIQAYIDNVIRQSKSPSDELADLAALRNSGAISDREFELAKAKVISQ
jgi:hypothetical protein